MKLYLLQDASGAKLPITDFPSALLSSRSGLFNFMHLYACRQFGREGRDFRIIAQPQCLVPLRVEQLVRTPSGEMEYGQSLVIE